MLMKKTRIVRIKQVKLFFITFLGLFLSCKEIRQTNISSNESIDVIKDSVKKGTIIENKESITQNKTSLISNEEYFNFHSNGELDNINIQGEEYFLGYHINDKKLKDKYLIFTQKEDKTSLYVYLIDGDDVGSELIWNFKESIQETEDRIYFLEDYINIDDIDGDGLVDMIYVYSTDSRDGYDRLNLVIRYKNAIITIKHIGASLDDERETEIDKSFFNLPIPIREKVYDYMSNINNKVIGINSNVLDEIGRGL